MRRASSERPSKLRKVQIIFLLKCFFTNPMLLHVMRRAKTNHPSVRWFEPDSSVRTTPDVRALYREG